MHVTALILSAVLAAPPGSSDYFKIRVVDEETGRGVPLVELRTVNDIRYYTDSAGLVAFYEPGLMNRTVFFTVTSHGYEFPKDGFGFRGKRLQVTPGGEAILKIKRLNVAERLYRVTGAGIYRDTCLLGEVPPIKRPVLNAQVFGSDSVLSTVYNRKIYWFWGDTNRPSYPLGNFHVPGATSRLPADGGLDPRTGVNLEYFTGEDGFARPTARMPGKGPTWLGGLVVLNEGNDRQRMFARYVKVEPPLSVYEHGLVEFNDDQQAFEKRATFDMNAPLFPSGHPLHHREEGVDYVYFATPFPLTRIPATAEALQDLSRYEAFTCLAAGSTADDPKLDRTPEGKLRYAWKQNTPPLAGKIRKTLIEQEELRPEEGLTVLRNIETGKPITGHGGSVYYNAYRKRWVMIVLESFGTSPLGEIWYAEADTPLGPWVYARKIVTHDKYSFYNPRQHPFFDQEDGRIIYFEGTYTSMFSGNPEQTPRYNYNQIMYSLDLADERLTLPVAIYETPADDSATAFRYHPRRPGTANTAQLERIAFFAPDRQAPGTIPVYEQTTDAGLSSLHFGEIERPENKRRLLFYALPAGMDDPPAATRPLYEYRHAESGRRRYSTNESLALPGSRRSELPVCRVWKNPIDIAISSP